MAFEIPQGMDLGIVSQLMILIMQSLGMEQCFWRGTFKH